MSELPRPSDTGSRRDDRPLRPAGQRSGASEDTRFWARQLTALGHVGMMFPVAIGIGFGAGYWADQRLGTAPWLSLAGFGLGVGAAVRNLIRSLAALERAEAELAAEPEGGSQDEQRRR